MVKVEQKVKFDPFIQITGFGSDGNRGKIMTGKVVMVNEPHSWFSVEYGDHRLRTSFKFCDIGKEVELCGH